VKMRLAITLWLAGAWIGSAGAPLAGEQAPPDDHRAHHEAMAAPARYTRTSDVYEVPDVPLLDQDGHAVSLTTILGASQSVAVNFIFTSCTTICPVQSATFAQLRGALGADADGLRLVTISIDPEFDTPEVMKKYAERFGATPQWRLLTGDAGRIATVLRAFKAFYGGKVNHKPVTLLRAAGSGTWVRIEGLARASDLAHEYRKLIGRDA
jgi:protein SCO1